MNLNIMRNLFITLCLWSTMSAAGDFPIVVDPFVTATPPGAGVTAGYFTMVNETDKEITITGAYSPTITKVEIHLSSIENDVAKMEQQESISIPPGDTLEFTHGSYHLMLMDLTQPLKPEETVNIILITSAGDMLIEMPVKKMGMMQHGSDQMSKKSKESEDSSTDGDKSSDEQMSHNQDSSSK